MLSVQIYAMATDKTITFNKIEMLMVAYTLKILKLRVRFLFIDVPCTSISGAIGIIFQADVQ